ncbi:TPA: fimbrial protein [Escherichia coli]|nr:fimbrial protein [Escherichia coli]EHD2967657.1 fimbrial protein [Escherichia coli]EKJ3308318.1 fimbrial protein [Escherichia coli]EKM4466114.1 fimbrial protein [Escherichia coli]NJB24000.1 fimbrial protein [Escherichia coli]
MRTLLSILLVWGALLLPAQANDNLHFFGNLLMGICTPVVQNGVMDEIDFGRLDADIFRSGNKESPRVPVVLQLTGCEMSLTTVTVTLSGTEATGMNGYLALDPTSQASGVAIGLETPDGAPVYINDTVGANFALTPPETTLSLNAWVKAIAGQELVVGTFTSIMTVQFEYF